MIHDEVRQQLAVKSGSTPASSSLFLTSLLPTPLDMAGTAELSMVLFAVVDGCMFL